MPAVLPHIDISALPVMGVIAIQAILNLDNTKCGMMLTSLREYILSLVDQDNSTKCAAEKCGVPRSLYD